LEAHDNNPQPHPTEPPGLVRPPAGRFAYASGSRPLAGYTIKRGVGQGGFGEIYYATSDAGKDVALKLIRRNLEVELRGIQQCLNLKHPNLLDLYDIRQDDKGDTWVVMEYVADPSLDFILAKRPAGFSPDEALRWIEGIGAGVAYLHDRGIVHRDLKPGNIFLDEGIVKVGDYGLSKFISCSRRSGHTESVGTVHYMAPEVANGRYGKELDVYAMGVIFYELLTGRVPFEGESIAEVLMKHLTATPDVSMIPDPYKAVISKALEKDPEKRYRSAAEMLAALPPCPAAVGPDRVLLNAFSEVKNHRAETPANDRFADEPVQAIAVKEDSFLWDPDATWKIWWPKLAPAVKVVIIMALLVWQYVLLSMIWSPRYHAMTGSMGYEYQNMKLGDWLLGVFPTMLLVMFLITKRLVYGKPEEKASRLSIRSLRDAKSIPSRFWNDPKSLRPLMILAVMAMIFWQYVMVAVTMGGNRRPWVQDVLIMFLPSVVVAAFFLARATARWISKEHPGRAFIGIMAFCVAQYCMFFTAADGPGSLKRRVDVMAAFLPTVLLIAYFVARWLISWTDRREPAKNWAESPTVVMPPSQPDGTEESVVVVSASPATAKRIHWPRYDDKPAPALVLKPPRERVADLLGSLLGSALVAAIASGVATLLEGYWANVQIQPEQFFWLWLVGIIGSWAVLLPSKLWEGRRGDPILRRFVMMVIGMGVGLAACGIDDTLMVKLRPARAFAAMPGYNAPPGFFDFAGQPLLMVYVACFGTLFLVMRWWRQADPLRRKRLKLSTLFVTVVVAMIVAQAWQFPQPWLPMAAATISVAVQVAGPHDRANRRRRWLSSAGR
jgi:hypothetical protein